jgi:hypothetical protein
MQQSRADLPVPRCGVHRVGMVGAVRGVGSVCQDGFAGMAGASECCQVVIGESNDGVDLVGQVVGGGVAPVFPVCDDPGSDAEDLCELDTAKAEELSLDPQLCSWHAPCWRSMSRCACTVLASWHGAEVFHRRAAAERATEVRPRNCLPRGLRFVEGTAVILVRRI